MRPFWRTPELELLGAFLYHYACAEKRPEAANEMYAALRHKEDGMNTPETVRKSLFRIWLEEGEAKGEAEGEARKERQVLRSRSKPSRPSSVARVCRGTRIRRPSRGFAATARRPILWSILRPRRI